MADARTSFVIAAKVTGADQIAGLNRGVKKLGETTDKTAGKFSKFNGLIRGLGSAVAAAGLSRIIGNASEVAAGFESETLLLKQGLENVGAGAAELDKLQASADRLGKATLFNEEDFRQGFGLLTSFGEIGVENYDKVAMAAANVAQVSGTDVSSSFMQLAKALNDPVKGLSALSRSGIQFTEDQKAMIEAMVAAGDTAGAQQMILAELEKQYGGTAVAAAGGAAGVKDTFGEAMYDLNVAIGKVVNEALPPLLNGLTTIINAFTNLPSPVQTAIVAIGGLAAVAVVLAPLVTAVTTLGPLISGLVGIIGGVVTALTGGGGVMAAITAVFSGPVGWIALVVAAGVAIYTFRDQIGAAFAKIGEFIQAAWNLYKSIWIDPVINAGKMIYDFFVENWGAISEFISGVLTTIGEFYKTTFIDPVIAGGQAIYDWFANTFQQIGEVIAAPFKAAFNIVRGVVNSILQGVANAINGVVNAINSVIRGANQAAAKVGLPQIPQIPQVQVPEFAEGGMVTGPTLAMVGEGGQPEYIVPASKAGAFAANIMAGVRGPGAIPRFAEGGYVAPAGANVSIQTGPVTQMNGTNYVTTQDLSRAVQAGVNQTLDLIRRDSSIRTSLGMV